jgi:hypothetical protein
MWIHLEQLWEIEAINVYCFLINIILMCRFFVCVILWFLKHLLKLSILIYKLFVIWYLIFNSVDLVYVPIYLHLILVLWQLISFLLSDVLLESL